MREHLVQDAGAALPLRRPLPAPAHRLHDLDRAREVADSDEDVDVAGAAPGHIVVQSAREHTPFQAQRPDPRRFKRVENRLRGELVRPTSLPAQRGSELDLLAQARVKIEARVHEALTDQHGQTQAS